MGSSTCFEHPNVHPQEDFYVQFYVIYFMHAYKQSGRWKDVLDTDIEFYATKLRSHLQKRKIVSKEYKT